MSDYNENYENDSDNDNVEYNEEPDVEVEEEDDENASELSDAIQRNQGAQILTDENQANIQVERITPNFLTKYEKARVIGTRALQISKNSPVLVDLGKDDYDPIMIAERELAEKKIPFVIRRFLPDGSYEDWKLSELEILDRFQLIIIYLRMFLISFIFIQNYLSGRIFPSNKHAIYNTISNSAQYADYSFNFSTESGVDISDTIHIIFPSQFTDSLSDQQITCNQNCTIYKREIIFKLNKTIEPLQNISLTIYDIMNPAEQGGVANFYIRVFSGGFLKDQNLRYGIIGISQQIQKLSSANVQIDQKGVNKAGMQNVLIFEFKTLDQIPSNVYIRLYFPKNTFKIENLPACQSNYYKGNLIKGVLYCQKIFQKDWDAVDIYGIEGEIKALTYYQISILLTNPSHEIITDNFGIAIIRNGTNVIFQNDMNIKGIEIVPANINQIEFYNTQKQKFITRNKEMQFRLSFYLTNYLQEQNVIKISIPVSIKVYDNKINEKSTIFYIERGLQRKLNDQILFELDTETNQLYIYNFQKKQDYEQISILLLLQTPDNEGLSSPLLIQTLTQKNMGFIIDQDGQFATFYVQNIKSPEIFSVKISQNTIKLQKEILSEITFTTQWTQTIPQNGFVKIILPLEIQTIDISSNNCLVQNSDDPTDMVDSQACYKIDNSIYIQIKTQFFKDRQRSFILKDCIIYPNKANRYLVDITSYLEDAKSPIESYQQPVVFESYEFLNPMFRILSNEYKQKGLVDIYFKLPIKIKNSQLPHSFVTPYSFIDVQIETTGNFFVTSDPNIGLPNGSIIPCNSYKDLISNTQIKCTLMTNNIPTIRIENYEEMQQGQKVGILIPDFYNSQGNVKLTVKIIQNNQDQYEEQCHYIQTIQVQNQILPETIIDISYKQDTYELNQDIIGEENIIQFNLSFQDRASNKDVIIVQMPFYQEGFCQGNDIKCYIQEQKFDCICISNIDWIWIQLSEFDELAIKEVQLKIEGIINPKSVSQDQIHFYARIIDSIGNTKRIYKYPALQKLKSKSFDNIIMEPEIQRLKSDSIYNIKIVSNIDLPENIIAILEFPYMYDLTQSNPSIRIEIQIDNKPIKNYNYRIATNKITIENITKIHFNQIITIQIKGINNPNYDGLLQNFNLQILNKDYFVIIENQDFAQFFLSQNYNIKLIELKQIEAFPLNASTLSSYTFDINLVGSILKGSYINIIFPDNYKNLPQNPYCIIKGCISSYQKCERSFQEIQIKLDKDYVYKDYQNNLQIQITNIINSDFGLQKYFQIQIRYSDQLIYQSDQLESHQVDIVHKPQEIEILEYQFTPQNEAEINTLTIKFLPYSQIDIQTQIILLFPEIFDNYIGDHLTITLELFQKRQLTYEMTNRKIVMNGLFSYTPNKKSPLILKIIGIVNPNQYTHIYQDQNYYIEMGLKQKQNNYFTDYSEKVLKLDVQRAPGQLTIHDINFSNLFCRQQSNLKFNVTFNQALPKEDVESFFIIDFPEQFNNIDGDMKTKSYSENWQNLKSKFISNKLYSTGNMEDYRGNFIGKVFGIQNPLDKTLLSAFNAKTYDQRNKKVIERSYANINPFNYQYIYPGPLIMINNEKDIILYKGTQSEQIEINIENQASINLTIIPSNKNLTYYPFPIDINIGTKYKYFQISVPQDFKSGEYLIYWKLQGEKYPKIYTPIKQSKIIIQSKTKLQIILQKYDRIPFTGYSLPYRFELEHAPDIQIEIVVNFKKDYEGLKLSKNILTFKPNKKVDQFYIYFDNVKDSKKVITEGSIDLKMRGINKDIYLLEQEELFFQVDPIDNEKGEIYNFNMIDFDKNWAQFQFSSTKIGVVYYLVALIGTQKPELIHLKKQQLKYNVIFKQFGQIYVYEHDIEKKIFKIENLLPSYEYIIYYFYENLTGISNQEPYQFEFKTKQRYKTADVSLRLNQTFLYFKEEIEILQHIALVLSLPENKVIKKKAQINQFFDEGRRLQSNNLQESMKIFFEFNILSVPENPYYPSPKILGDSLNQKMQMLKSRVQQLDDSYRIQSSEFQSVLPKFVVNPKIENYDYKQVTLQFQFDNIGWIYAVAIENSDSKFSLFLTPFQIFLGLDYFNQETPSAKLDVLKTYQNINLTIDNLKPLTFYEIFLIVADSDPGYQMLQEQKEIKRFQITTLEAPKEDFLYLTSRMFCVVFFVFVLFFFEQFNQIKIYILMLLILKQYLCEIQINLKLTIFLIMSNNQQPQLKSQVEQNVDEYQYLQEIIEQRANSIIAKREIMIYDQDHLENIIVGFDNQFKSDVIVELFQQQKVTEMSELKINNNITVFILQLKLQKSNDIILKIKDKKSKIIHYEVKLGVLDNDQKILCRWIQLNNDDYQKQKDFIISCLQYIFNRHQQQFLYFNVLREFEKILQLTLETNLIFEIDDIFDKQNYIDQLNFILYFCQDYLKQYNNQIVFKEGFVGLLKENIMNCLEQSYFQAEFRKYQSSFLQMLRTFFIEQQVNEDVFKTMVLNDHRVGMQMYFVDFAIGFQQQYFSSCLISHIVSICNVLGYYNLNIEEFLLKNNVSIAQITVYLDSKIKQTTTNQNDSLYQESFNLYNSLLKQTNTPLQLEELKYLFENFLNFHVIIQEILISINITKYIIQKINVSDNQQLYDNIIYIADNCPVNFLFCIDQISDYFLMSLFNSNFKREDIIYICKKLFGKKTIQRYMNLVVQNIILCLANNDYESLNQFIVKGFELDLLGKVNFEELCKSQLQNYFKKRFSYRQDFQEYFICFTKQSFVILSKLNNDQRLRSLQFQQWINQYIFEGCFLDKPSPQIKEKSHEKSFSEDQKKRIQDLKKKKEDLKNQNLEKEEINKNTKQNEDEDQQNNDIQIYTNQNTYDDPKSKLQREIEIEKQKTIYSLSLEVIQRMNLKAFTFDPNSLIKDDQIAKDFKTFEEFSKDFIRNQPDIKQKLEDLCKTQEKKMIQLKKEEELKKQQLSEQSNSQTKDLQQRQKETQQEKQTQQSINEVQIVQEIKHIPKKNYSTKAQQNNNSNNQQDQRAVDSGQKEDKQIILPQKTNYQYLAGNICQQISFLYQNFIFFDSLMITNIQQKKEDLLIILDNYSYIDQMIQQKKFACKQNQLYTTRMQEIKNRLQKNQLLYNSIKKQIDFFPIYDYKDDQKICVTQIANNQIDFKYSLINNINYDFLIQQFQHTYFIYIIDFEDILQQRIQSIQLMQEFFQNFCNKGQLQDLIQTQVILFVIGTVNKDQQEMFATWLQENKQIIIDKLDVKTVFDEELYLEGVIQISFRKQLNNQNHNLINIYFFDSQTDDVFNYLRQFEQQIFKNFQIFNINELQYTINNLSVILDIFSKSIDHTIYEYFLKPISQIWLFILYVYLKVFHIYDIKKQPKEIKQFILENVKILNNHDHFFTEYINKIQHLNFDETQEDQSHTESILHQKKDQFIKNNAKLLKKETENFFNTLYDNVKQNFSYATQKYNDLLTNKKKQTHQTLLKMKNQIEITEMLQTRINDIICKAKISIYEFVFSHDINDLLNFQIVQHEACKIQEDHHTNQTDQNQNEEDYENKIITLDQAIFAIQQNDSQTLELFLSQDPYNVKLLDADNNTLIYHAVFNSSPQCTKLLKQYNDKLKAEEPLDVNPFELLAKDNYQDLEALAAQNIDLDCFEQINTVNKGRINLLMFSVYLDKLNIFKFLIEILKLNVNAQNELGESVIHFCCKLKKDTFLQFLLKKDICDINIKKNDGKTPLYICVLNDFMSGINQLLKKEVNLKERFENENSLYHICVIKKKQDILQKLLLNVTSIDYKNKDGDTPLHLALKQQDIIMVDLLIKQSNVELKDNQDQTPLMIAFNLRNFDLINILINNKANVNKKTIKGKTLIHMAVESNWIELVVILIRSSAQINKQDENGNTPLHIAYKKFNKKIIQLLEHNSANLNAKNDQGLLPKQMKPLIRPDMFKVKEKK